MKDRCERQGSPAAAPCFIVYNRRNRLVVYPPCLPHRMVKPFEQPFTVGQLQEKTVRLLGIEFLTFTENCDMSWLFGEVALTV